MSAPSNDASLKDLVAAGVLEPGTVLRPRAGAWGTPKCRLLTNGDLEVDGKTFSSPSGAGHHVRKGSANGWVFWELPDGRRLKDLRAQRSNPISAGLAHEA